MKNCKVAVYPNPLATALFDGVTARPYFRLEERTRQLPRYFFARFPTCLPLPGPVVDPAPRYKPPGRRTLDGLPGLVQRWRHFADVPGHEVWLAVVLPARRAGAWDLLSTARPGQRAGHLEGASLGPSALPGCSFGR